MNTAKRLGMVVFVTAATGAVVPFASHGATYAYDDDQAEERTLYVQVGDGEKETFDASYMALTGASVTNLVKRGDGTLEATSDLTSYTFDICVEDGVFKFNGKSVLGSAGGSITVLDGATLWNTGVGNNAELDKSWTVYFSGSGHEGMGALHKENYSYKAPFGSQVMTGDAKAVWYSGVQDYMGPLDMNGHTLDLYMQSGYFSGVDSITNAGTICINGNPSAASSYVQFYNWNNLYGCHTNKISYSNIVWNVRNIAPYKSALDWTLEFLPESGIKLVDGTYAPGGTYNKWSGPVVVGRDSLPISVKDEMGELSFAFADVVSGGGLNLQGSDTTTLGVYLLSGENTFTNGIVGQYVNLHLATNGALLADGGPLALTNSTLSLDDDSSAYSLPAAEFSGAGSVKGGHGQWTSFAKTGAGSLDYASAVGSSSLDISEGSVDLTDAPATNRHLYAGLVEGLMHLSPSDYTSSGTDRYKVFNMANTFKGNTATNSITSGTRLLYDWTKDPETGWTTNLLLSYEGYIWNDSPTNELWAFAGGGAEGSDWHLRIDGATVVGKCVWSSTRYVSFCAGVIDGSAVNGNYAYDLHTNTVVVSPGPHRFEYRHAISLIATSYGLALCGSVGGNGYFKKTLTGDGYENWSAERGLMFNRTGKCTRDINDYSQLIDPGDGSLFTWDIPSTNAPSVHPVSGESIGLMPSFDSLKMSAGTSILVPDGATLAFTDVEGWPTVTGGNVEVADSLTLDCSEMGESSFAISGSLAFGEGASIRLLCAKPSPGYSNKELVLGTAAGGISGSPSIVKEGGADECARWSVWIDGSSVKAMYSQCFVIIVR